MALSGGEGEGGGEARVGDTVRKRVNERRELDIAEGGPGGRDKGGSEGQGRAGQGRRERAGTAKEKERRSV